MPNPQVSQALQANPMFGRPTWTYVQVQRGPVRGPQPRLAQGTGLTGDPELPGNAATLPGYLSDYEYEPTFFDFSPSDRESFLARIPPTILTGTNGRDEVGTYQPHDFTPGRRFLNHMRRAYNWQDMSYPPSFRNLLAWQQVARYNLQSYTLSARPLTSANYFLGYQIQSEVAGQIGQSTLGYMGSM